MRYIALSVITITLLAIVGATTFSDKAGDRPNVVLITMDTVRADRIGAYGYERAQTPALDDLAERGVVFERAYAQAPLTLPSHASFLTGRYPLSHGIHLNGFYKLGQDEETLAETLREQDYATGAFVSAFVLDSKFGLDQGFDIYSDDLAGIGGSAVEQRADETTNRAIAWLRQRLNREPDQPFFLWVHYFDPHAPYAAPEPWASRFSDPYDAEIAYTDRQIGRLMQQLRDLGVEERTMVIASSDHGESFGEHGEDTHGLFAYDATIRVPLIVKPAATSGFRARLGRSFTPGSRVPANVESVDIVPTVREVLGIGADEAIDGQSLLTAALDSDAHHHRTLYAESFYPVAFGWSPIQSLRRGDLKLIESPAPELYDVAVDPGEQENLHEHARHSAAELNSMLAELIEERQSTGEGEELDADQRMALEALGYLGGGPNAALLDAGEGETLALPEPRERLGVYRKINEAAAMVSEDRPWEAIQLLAPYRQQEAMNPIYHQVLGNAFLRAGEAEAGVMWLERYAELSGGAMEAGLALAQAWLGTGETEKAVAELTNVVNEFPGYIQAWEKLAMAHRELGETAEAHLAENRARELRLEEKRRVQGRVSSSTGS